MVFEKNSSYCRVRARGFWVLAIRIQYPKTSICWESYFILFHHGKVEGETKSRQWWAWSPFFGRRKSTMLSRWNISRQTSRCFWMLSGLHPWPEERWRNGFTALGFAPNNWKIHFFALENWIGFHEALLGWELPSNRWSKSHVTANV